jgi:hypothetical protein
MKPTRERLQSGADRPGGLENLEKDSKNLRLLMSLWDEGGGSPW